MWGDFESSDLISVMFIMETGMGTCNHSVVRKGNHCIITPETIEEYGLLLQCIQYRQLAIGELPYEYRTATNRAGYSVMLPNLSLLFVVLCPE